MLSVLEIFTFLVAWIHCRRLTIKFYILGGNWREILTPVHCTGCPQRKFSSRKDYKAYSSRCKKINSLVTMRSPGGHPLERLYMKNGDIWRCWLYLSLLYKSQNETVPSGSLGDHCYFTKCIQVHSQNRHFSMQLLLLSLCSLPVLPVTFIFTCQIDFIFLLNKKKIKTLFFFFPLRLLIARKIFQFYDIKVSFNNVRFPTYSVLHSPMLLNIAIKVYTVHFTFFSFCPDNSWLHL